MKRLLNACCCCLYRDLEYELPPISPFSRAPGKGPASALQVTRKLANYNALVPSCAFMYHTPSCGGIRAISAGEAAETETEEEAKAAEAVAAATFAAAGPPPNGLRRKAQD